MNLEKAKKNKNKRAYTVFLFLVFLSKAQKEIPAVN